MLRCIRSISQLDFEQLSAVYRDELPTRREQEEFYQYLLDFFADPDSLYYIWENDGQYICALRAESYKDGYLIAGLHCRKEYRNEGFAKKLIAAACKELKGNSMTPIYSHVDKRNNPSLRTHAACGFRQELDYAAFIDGSVSWSSCTLCMK